MERYFRELLFSEASCVWLSSHGSSIHTSCSSPGVASAMQNLAGMVDIQIVDPVISCFKEMTLFSADGGVGSRKHSF